MPSSSNSSTPATTSSNEDGSQNWLIAQLADPNLTIADRARYAAALHWQRRGYPQDAAYILAGNLTPEVETAILALESVQ